MNRAATCGRRSSYYIMILGYYNPFQVNIFRYTPYHQQSLSNNYLRYASIVKTITKGAGTKYGVSDMKIDYVFRVCPLYANCKWVCGVEGESDQSSGARWH